MPDVICRSTDIRVYAAKRPPPPTTPLDAGAGRAGRGRLRSRALARRKRWLERLPGGIGLFGPAALRFGGLEGQISQLQRGLEALFQLGAGALGRLEIKPEGDKHVLRPVLSRSQIVEMVRTFLPESNNEARIVDTIDSHIAKAAELGFLRRLRADSDQFEVCRMAFIDGQWLHDLDQVLSVYQSELVGSAGERG